MSQDDWKKLASQGDIHRMGLPAVEHSTPTYVIVQMIEDLHKEHDRAYRLVLTLHLECMAGSKDYL